MLVGNWRVYPSILKRDLLVCEFQGGIIWTGRIPEWLTNWRRRRAKCA